MLQDWKEIRGEQRREEKRVEGRTYSSGNISDLWTRSEVAPLMDKSLRNQKTDMPILYARVSMSKPKKERERERAR